MPVKITKTAIKEIKLQLPIDIANSIHDNEIISLLINKVLTKVEYYHSKCKLMEEKYKMDFDSFNKKINGNKIKENFSEWDDFILWEGYILAYKEYNKKYKALKRCMN